MDHSGEQRSLFIELAGWLLVCLAAVALVANFSSIRSALSGAMIAQLEKSSPPVKSAAVSAGTNTRLAKPSEPTVKSNGSTVELEANSSGHFEAPVEINGRRIEALVDTGATLVMLSYEDARNAGIHLSPQDFTLSTQTANGIAKAAPVMLDRVEIGSIMIRRVRGAVAEPGKLSTNLLGMSFLKRLQRSEIRSGRLVLQE